MQFWIQKTHALHWTFHGIKVNDSIRTFYRNRNSFYKKNQTNVNIFIRNLAKDRNYFINELEKVQNKQQISSAADM